MKEKIIAAIKAKFPAVNLSKERLDAIAAKIETKATDETQIDAQIDAFNDFNPLSDIAKTDDKIRGLEAKVKKPATPTTKTETETKEEGSTETTTSKDEAPPKWAQTLMKQVESLTTEKVQGSIRSKVTEKLGKEVPVAYWEEWTLPDKEDDIEAFVGKVKEKHTAYKQSQLDETAIGMSTPLGGGGEASAKPTGKEDQDIKAWAESKKVTQPTNGKPTVKT